MAQDYTGVGERKESLDNAKVLAEMRRELEALALERWIDEQQEQLRVGDYVLQQTDYQQQTLRQRGGQAPARQYYNRAFNGETLDQRSVEGSSGGSRSDDVDDVPPVGDWMKPSAARVRHPFFTLPIF